MNYAQLFGILPKETIKWMRDDVEKWLRLVGLEALTKTFKQHSVDGSVIMALDETDLRKELGVKSKYTVDKLMLWILKGLREYSDYVRQRLKGQKSRTRQFLVRTSSDPLKRPANVFEETMFSGIVRQQETIVFSKSLVQEQPKKKETEKMLILIPQFEGRRLGSSYPIFQNGAKIGSTPKADVLISDVTVNETHAEVFFQDDNFKIYDLCSQFGTFVRIDGRHKLKDGMLIEIGSSLLQVVLKKQSTILKIQVVDGQSIGQQFEFGNTNQTISIGRKEKNDFAFPHDHHMSNFHALVFKVDSQFFIQCLSSTNGTWQRLSLSNNRSQNYILTNKAIIKFGMNSQFICKLSGPSKNQTKPPILCSVCLSNPKDCLFLPCKHVVACMSCGAGLEKCSCCSASIESKLKVYGA